MKISLFLRLIVFIMSRMGLFFDEAAMKCLIDNTVV